MTSSHEPKEGDWAVRTQFLLRAHELVKALGKDNFQGTRILLPSKFNFSYLETQLRDYHDRQVIDMLKFGFPVDCTPPSGIQGSHPITKGQLTLLSRCLPCYVRNVI